MASCLKKDGLLFIDHRNYDAILDTGKAPSGKNIYYPVRPADYKVSWGETQPVLFWQSDHVLKIETTTSYQDGKPTNVRLDYTIDMLPLLSVEQQKKLRRMSEEEQAQIRWLGSFPIR